MKGDRPAQYNFLGLYGIRIFNSQCRIITKQHNGEKKTCDEGGTYPDKNGACAC